MEEIFGFVLLAGPAILAWQGYSWLKTGVWTALPLSKVFTYFEWPMPSTEWLDDRFHEISMGEDNRRGTRSMLVDSSFEKN